MVSKTLILGLGNPILTDDGVGIRVVLVMVAAIPQAVGTSWPAFKVIEGFDKDADLL